MNSSNNTIIKQGNSSDMDRFLGFLYQKFMKEYVELEGENKPEDLCKIYDVGQVFNANNILRYDPAFQKNIDYDDIHVQEYYLLRLAYAYVFEYRYMYNDLFDNFIKSDPFPDEKIDVTSFGCGSMLDYYGLVCALNDTKDNSIKKNKIAYMGCDLAKWEHKLTNEEYKTSNGVEGPFVTGRPDDKVDFVNEDVCKYLKNQVELTSDIFFFPKSIGDIGGENYKNYTLFGNQSCSEIKLMFDLIAEKSAKSVMYFMISYPNSNNNLANKISENMLPRYTLDKSNSNMTIVNWNNRPDLKDDDGNQGKRIVDVEGFFTNTYPVLREDKNRQIFVDLAEKCPQYDNCLNKDECKNLLGYWPTLRTTNMNYQILKFNRSR